MNLDSIKSILTLRYDDTQTPILPKLTSRDLIKKENFSIENIHSQLISYLQKQIPNDYSKPISISLSGGVDSSLLLCILKERFPDNQIDAISIKFSDSVDETETASQIAKKVGVNHHIVEVDNYLEKLSDAISITKLPFWDIHWYYIVENAKHFSNYLVSGDGGDELFGGYTFRYSKFLSLTKPDSTPLEKIRAYLSCHERDWVPDQEKIFNSKTNFSWKSINSIFTPFFDNSLSPLNQVFLADYNGKLLYNFSIIGNKINQFFNLKPVVPILDPELISYASHLSPESKYDLNENKGKLPLRSLLSKYQCDSLISKEKLGFSVNTINLWNSIGKELSHYYLDDARIVEDGWINKEWISSNITKSDLDIKYINKFLGLLSLEIWYRLFVTKEMNSTTKLS